MAENAAFSFLLTHILLVSALFFRHSFAASRSVDWPFTTTVFDVSASIQGTRQVLSFDPQSFQEVPTITQTTTTTTTSSFSVSVHPRSALHRPTHKDYKALTLSRLARDSARLNFIRLNIEFAINGFNTSHLRPEKTTTVFRPEDFQSPLTSGVRMGSGEYFSRLGVGRPAKDYYMVVDTGSDVSWLQCLACTDCYQQSDPIFDPSKSSSYRSLPCGSPECQALQDKACRAGQCLYEVSYGDGSFTVGNFATETLTFGSSGSTNNVGSSDTTHHHLISQAQGAMVEDNIYTMRRRLASVAGHLAPMMCCAPTHGGFVGLRACFASTNDSYHRIHGEASTDVPVWRAIVGDENGKEFTDIIYEKAVGEAIAKITINRPERRNAFRPQTVKELMYAFNDARDDGSIGVIILTGKGTEAFSSGGDQALRNKDGYADYENFGRLNVLDLQVQIRRLPKPVIAMVAGYAVGGGHVLHMVCDLTVAAENAIFGQTGPKVGSFDAGYGSSIMSRLVGPKKAREMWFLARFYTAAEAEKMGLVNTVVPLENLEKETVKWCREILRNSPTAIRVLKSSLNAVDDGHAGLQELGGNATLIFYGSEEGNEGKTAYIERRRPDFSKFPRLP